MRIAQLYPHARIGGTPPTASDAISIVQLALCCELARHETVLALAGRSRGEPARDDSLGFELVRIGATWDRVANLGRLFDGWLFAWQRPFRTRGLYGRSFARHAIRILRAWQPDVIHLHATAPIAPLLRRGLPEIPLILHVHDHALAEFDRAWAERCLAACDRVLCCSGFVADRLKQRFPDRASRVGVLWNGVDEVFFGPAASTVSSQDVLFVGRLAPEKGVHLLIEAFSRIASRFPASRLRLVGPDSYSPPEFVDPEARELVTAALRRWTTDPKGYARYLRALAAPLGERVRFEGATDYFGVAAAMRQAAVFAFPSLWHEPFGMPVVEAMAAGLPVVATRAGAFLETVVEGRTGCLVERGDREELAEALAGLLANPQKRQAMGQAGRERALRFFTWRTICEQLREVYTRMRSATARCQAPAASASA